MKGCLEAVRAGDHQMLDQHTNLVRGRCMRMLHAVQCGMEERTNQCSADQLECVNQAVVDVRNKGLSVYSVYVRVCVRACVCVHACEYIHEYEYICTSICDWILVNHSKSHIRQNQTSTASDSNSTILLV